MNLILNNNVSNNEQSTTAITDVLDQTKPYTGASDQYSVITTREILNFLESKGFQYSKMWEQKYRKVSRAGFGKHALRITHKDISFGTGLNSEITPQFYLWNSYDRTMRFKLVGGGFRGACSNMMAFGTHYFEPLQITHKNIDYTDLNYKIDDAVLRLTKVSDVILELKDVTLSLDQKHDFANRMAKLRLGNSSDIIEVVNFRDLLTVRRDDDRSDSAWNVANVVQENLLSPNGSMNLNYKKKVIVNNNELIVNKTTKTLRSEWVKNKVNMAIFDVMKNVVENKPEIILSAA